MLNTLLGTKINQSQSFSESGNRLTVTHIKVTPNIVVGHKSRASDGYDALVLGFGQINAKSLNKPELGRLKKAGQTEKLPRFLREVRLDQLEKYQESYKLGMEIKINQVFNIGDIVSVSGISKGKGFAGVVKRHHFKGGPATHGQSDRERAPGSIGQTTTPGRVYKGKRMAGRMGSDLVTIKNLRVVAIDQEKNVLTIKGLVPGGRNSLLVITKFI